MEADSEAELRVRLEEEGEKILGYFASNRMIANASKTALVVFRSGSQLAPFQITLSGEVIVETEDEKVLGVIVQRDSKWTNQCNKVTAEVNYATSVLRRLRHHLGCKELRTVADGIAMSKIRYCLPVYAGESIRLSETDPQSSALQRIQCAQNEMLRTVTGKRQRDHVRIADLLEATGFLSVNQAAAYGLLLELWKAREFGVPVLSELLERKRIDERTLRSDSAKNISSSSHGALMLKSVKLWNATNSTFKSTNLLTVAKKEAKAFVKMLPI